MSRAIRQTNGELDDDSGRAWTSRAQGFLRRVSATPTAAFIAVLPLVALTEALSAWIVEDWLSASGLHHAYTDAIADVLAIMPMLYFLFVRPTARAFKAKTALEQELLAARDALEERVVERTRALQDANARLNREMEDRCRAQQSVEFQTSLLDAVEQAVIGVDSRGQIRYWNRFAGVLYGWEASEVKGRDIRGIVQLVDGNGRRADYIGACTDGKSWLGWVDSVRRDGSRFATYAVCSQLPCRDGGYVLLSLDITDLQRAEEALRQSEERYISLVENSPTGIFLVQRERVIFANRTLSAMLDHPIDALIGVRVARLVHPDDRGRLSAMNECQAPDSDASERFEYRFLDRSGRVRWVLLRCVRVDVRDGSAMLCNIQDLTDQKRMEGDLRDLSTRLLVIQEEERARVARDLHDGLGQTLSAIKLAMELTLNQQRPDERRKDFKRLSAMVPITQNAIDELRQITYALRPPMLDSLGLTSTMEWYLDSLKQACPTLSVEKEWTARELEIPTELKAPIFRILQEATNNAVKHSGTTRLWIGLRRDEDRLEFWVRDAGRGFDPKSVSHLEGHCGSGLSSMRERVTLSGGRFTLSAAEGLGTRIQASWDLVAHGVADLALLSEVE